jgi:hypothetical protein
MPNTVLSHMSKWFTSNKLVLNLDKTNIIKFITNKSPQCDLYIGYDEKYTEKSINTKCLGLQIDNHLKWKIHINLMIPKLSRTCYAIRLMSHISSTDTLKSIYFVYFHSIMKYGITFFWAIPSTVKLCSLCRREMLDLLLVSSLGIHADSYSCDYSFYLFHVNVYSH